MTIGEKVHQLRKERDVSLRRLSEITKLAKSTISDIENDVTKGASIESLEKIAYAFSVPVSYFFDEEAQAQEIAKRLNDRVDTIMEGAIGKSDKLVRALHRAKDQPTETLDDIAEFIDIIIERELAKRKEKK